MKTWKASFDTMDEYGEKAKYLGPIEFQSEDGEYHNFEVLETPDRLIFGGACNVGFLESGHLIKEDDESTDQALCELLAELEQYYRARSGCNRIVCNERM